MHPEQWHQLKPVVQAALELEPDERSDYIANTLGDDRELLREAEILLRTYEDLGDFIEKPVFVGRIEVHAPDTEVDLAGRRLGPYEIVRELGRGGMGAVYLARDTRLGRNVAIKLLPGSLSTRGQLLRRFQREARAISQLNHPNIITIHEIEQSGADDFIVTEYVEGSTLRERLAAGPLAIKDAIDISMQTASALAAAHASGIVHRDIKPENIMIRRDGLVKVLDFGIAKLVEQAGDNATDLTLTGAGRMFPIGTPKYMSPEQMRGQAVDARTDIWSLGCVLHEMLTAATPFSGATTSDLIVAVLEREPRSLPERLLKSTPALRRVMERSLAKDRDLRYGSIEEMSSDLQAVRESVPILTNGHAEIATTEANSKAPFAWSRLAVAASTAVLIAGLVAVFLWIWGDIRPVSNGVAPDLTATVQRLTTDPAFDSHGCFSPDGKRIVFSSNRDGGETELYTMNADGTEPVRLTNNLVEDVHPRFSPDGKQIAFASKRGERFSIFVIAADGTGERQITDGVNVFHPEWSFDGTRIVFRTDEIKANDVDDSIDGGRHFALCVINPDGTRLQCFPTSGWDNTPSWSPDGTQIAFSSKRDATTDAKENAEIYVMKSDGSGVTRLTDLPDSFDVNPRFSPDGMHIAFTSIRYGVGRIFVMRVDGSHLQPLQGLDDDGSSDFASWSPDGRRILVGHNRDAVEPEIYSIAAPATSILVSRLTSHGATEMMPDISPDGSAVVFVSNREGDSKIFIMNADGTGVRRLTDSPFGELSPAWSPDGKRIAFEHNGTGRLQIFIINPDGTDLRQITHHPEGCGRAAWSPDGNWLAFQCGPHPVTDIYLARADAGELFQITSDKEFDGDPTWSPDGTRIAFTSGRELIPGAGGGIMVMNRDGSGMRQLTDFPAFNANPDWSPDGKRIAFKSDRDGNFELYLIDVEGGVPESITNHSAYDGEPEWSRDGRSIVFDSKRDGNREIHLLRFGVE